MVPPPPPLTGRPDAATVRAALDSRRTDLDACVAEALGVPGAESYAGKLVGLLLVVGPSGRAQGRLDAAPLDAAPLGACVRRVAAQLSFPPFVGEPVEVRVPLVLGPPAG